jgi:hypothetical protein
MSAKLVMINTNVAARRTKKNVLNTDSEVYLNNKVLTVKFGVGYVKVF